MRIQKRLPFGFRGNWGKLYKRYTSDQTARIKDGETVTYEKNTYRDIGEDVQFKLASAAATSSEQPLSGSVTEVSYLTVKTTDAYFDNARGQYACIVSPGDLVKVFGRLWICETVKTTSRFTPAKQDFYYCDLKSIL